MVWRFPCTDLLQEVSFICDVSGVIRRNNDRVQLLMAGRLKRRELVEKQGKGFRHLQCFCILFFFFLHVLHLLLIFAFCVFACFLFVLVVCTVLHMSACFRTFTPNETSIGRRRWIKT